MDRIKVSVGHSTDIDAALNYALKDIKRPTAIITFFSSRYNPEEIYRKIRDKVGDKVDIVGTSTAGEISNIKTDCQANTVSIVAVESPYLNIGVGVGENLSKNVKEATYNSVKKAAISLDKTKKLTTINILQRAYVKKPIYDLLRTKFFINMLLLDGLNQKEEEYLRYLSKIIPKESTVIGGSAGDDLKFKKTYLIGNGVYSDAAVLTMINTFLKVGTAMGHPYYPTNKGALVTKSRNRIVYELNNKPAADVLKELLGVDKLSYEIFAKYTIGLKSIDIFGEYMIKSPMIALPDGSVKFHAEIPEGSFLTIMKTDEEYLIESFKKTLLDAVKDAGSPKKIGVIMLFNCVLRYLLKCHYGINDIYFIKNLLGEDIPVIGFNTYGEQGRTLGGSLGHFNQTSTILVIGNELVDE